MANVSSHLDFLEARLAALVEERKEVLRRYETVTKPVLWNTLSVIFPDLTFTVAFHRVPKVENNPYRWCMVLFYFILLAALLLVLLGGKLQLWLLKRDGVVVQAKILMLRAQAVEFAGSIPTGLGELVTELRTELLLSSIEDLVQGGVEPSAWRIWAIAAWSIPLVLGTMCLSLSLG